jgi:hypothetical protein
VRLKFLSFMVFGSIIFHKSLKMNVSVATDVATVIPQTANVMYDFGMDSKVLP